MAFDKFRLKVAQKLMGGKISKSAPNIVVPEQIRSLITGDPYYTSLNNYKALENEYSVNPVLSSVINLRSDYSANAVVSVKNIKNGDIITDKDFKKSKSNDLIVNKMFRLKNNPNPTQSTKEFLSLVSIFKDVFGNSYIYGNSATDTVNIRDIGFMWGVWPQYMKPIMSGGYFDATSIDAILKGWEWEWGTYKKEFKNNQILHRKEPNIRLKSTSDLILGESRQVSLQWPLSNVRVAYESRNVIAKERGARAIISPDNNDVMMGSVPMENDEKEEVQKDFRRYGLRKGQDQFIISKIPLRVTQIDQDVRKLGLIPEIASDGMVIANRYGVPEVLLKLYMKGATFENQESSERRMYQNTTIPESNDRIEDLNVWLKCRDFGYEYIISYDHIPVLQENEKDRSEINKNINTVYEKLFFGGAVTYNTWIQALGIPMINESWAKKRITEMTDEEIFRIKGNYTLNQSLDENDQN
jgi:hypothetical protein